ncbi:hypothetical protein DFH28DRAFT_1131482 [Melampsora americana]|nr:hypothetical protein DFH28DRAFT_1131482 [Melampsora americana]
MEEGARMTGEITSDLAHQVQSSEHVPEIPTQSSTTHRAHSDVLPHAEGLPHAEELPHAEGLPAPDAYIFLFRDERDAMKWSTSHGGAGVGGLFLAEPQTLPIGPTHPTIPLLTNPYPTSPQPYLTHTTAPYQLIAPVYPPPYPQIPTVYPPAYEPVSVPYLPHVPSYPHLPSPYHEPYDPYHPREFGSSHLGYPSLANLRGSNLGRNPPGPSKKWKKKDKKKGNALATPSGMVNSLRSESSSESDRIIRKTLDDLKIKSKDQIPLESLEGSSMKTDRPERVEESEGSDSKEIESSPVKESLDPELLSSKPLSKSVNPIDQKKKIVSNLIKEKGQTSDSSKPIKADRPQKKPSFLEAILSYPTGKPEISQVLKDGVLTTPSESKKLDRIKSNLAQKNHLEQEIKSTFTVKKGKGSKAIDSQRSMTDELQSVQKKVLSASEFDTMKKGSDSSIRLGSDQGRSPQIISNEHQASSSKLRSDDDGWQIYINKKSQKGDHPTLLSNSRSSTRKSKFKNSNTLDLLKDQDGSKEEIPISFDQDKSLPEEVEESGNVGKESIEGIKPILVKEQEFLQDLKSSKSSNQKGKGKGKGKGKKTMVDESSRARSGKKSISGSSEKSADDLALEEALASKQSKNHKLNPERIEHIKKVVLKMLQKDNRTPFANIYVNMQDYTGLFKGVDPKTEEDMQELIFGPVFQDLIDSVGNPEGQRRHRALRDQLDERVIRNHWQSGLYHNTISEPIKRVAKLLAIDQIFPIFYDAKPGDWEKIRDELHSLEEEDLDDLEEVIDYYQIEKRLATIWVMQQANLRNDRSFKESELKSLAVQGINLPILIALCDRMRLKPRSALPTQSSESAQIHRYVEIYRLMHGKFSVGVGVDAYDMEDDANWLDSPVRYFLTENEGIKAHFEGRFRELVEEGKMISISYRQWAETIGMKLEGKIEEVQISFAEGLVSAHFGLSLEDLMILRNKIQQTQSLRRFGSESSLMRSNPNLNLFETNNPAQIQWPKNAERLLPKAERFKQFFEYFGKKLIINKSRGK